jgi:hypothetical protein
MSHYAAEFMPNSVFCTKVLLNLNQLLNGPCLGSLRMPVKSAVLLLVYFCMYVILLAVLEIN